MAKIVDVHGVGLLERLDHGRIDENFIISAFLAGQERRRHSLHPNWCKGEAPLNLPSIIEGFESVDLLVNFASVKHTIAI